MIITKPCSKCGTLDYPKYTRKRAVNKTGARGSRVSPISISSYCVMCHAEDQKEREARRYEKKLAYNREWRKSNRDKVNEYNRIHYKKKIKGNYQRHSLYNEVQKIERVKISKENVFNKPTNRQKKGE